MLPRVTLILITLVFLCPTPTIAQQSTTTPSPDKSGDKALKEKAYDLLDSLATQISTLQSAENRARMGSNIAAAIWTHDEKRARALFVAVGEDIKLGLQQPEDINRGDDQTMMVFLHLRENTVDRIAKLDPEFAFDFLKATEPTFETDPPYGVAEKDKALSVRLAKQVAAANPDLSLKVGRKALSQGFSEDLLSLLRQLLRKNTQQGATLYKETVQRLRDVEFNEKLMTTGQGWQTLNFTFALAALKPPLADDATYKEFMDMLISAALKNKCDKQNSEEMISYFCSEIGTLVAQIEKVDPQRAVKLKHLQSEEENGERPWGPEVYTELEELVQAKDYDGIFELSKTYPGLKDSMYWRAFQLAHSSGDIERAKKIASEYNGDPEMKKRMFAELDEDKAEPPETEVELEAIEKEVAKQGGVNAQLALLSVVALQIGPKDRAVALKLYDQMLERVQELKAPNQRIAMQVFVAMLYCMEKSDRGFTLMESLMPKLNELIDSAIKLDGLDTNYMRDGEWNMSANGPLGKLLTELSQNAGYFAWHDFDRAVNLAAQFERNEIRMMAQLKLAQSILSGPPKRYSFNTN